MVGYVATIGMFDGVHLGHQFVLHHVLKTAREQGLLSMAITFDQTMRRDQVLTSLDDKRRLLSQAGIDRIEVLQFTDELRLMTAREFMQRELKEQLNVKVLLTGYDNRFGHDRKEGFDDYVRYGQELGIAVRQLPPAPPTGTGEETAVSSSYIRRLLTDGQVEAANCCLGYAYQLSGMVVHGEQIGRQLGFPTANLQLDDDCKLVPKSGVYAVTAELEGHSTSFLGMMNIGTRPTFNGQKTTLETHLFDFDGDVYGRRLSVSLVARLRDELHFDHTEDLRHQMTIDKEKAIQLLTKI